MQLVVRLGCDINVGDRTEVSDKGQGSRHLVTRRLHIQRGFRRNGVRGGEESLGQDMPKLRAGESRKGNVQEDSCHTEASMLPTPGFVS